MKKFSFAVSYLFHPILIAFYGLLIIIFRLNFVMLNDKFLEAISVISFFLMVVLPFFLIFIGYKFKIFPSIYLEKKEERYIPLLITGISYYLAYNFFSSWNLPAIILLYILGAILTIVVSTLISLLWKISLHSLSIGSLSGMLLGISTRLQINITIEFLIIILLSGLIIGSRLYLNAHTKSEVYVGYACGFIGMYLLFVLI